MNVARWLRKLGLEEYEPKFRENKIDVDVLPSLTSEDLKDLGINLVGDRRRLLDAIAALRAEAAPARNAAATPAPAATRDSAAISPTTDPQRRQLTLMFCDLVGSTALSTQVDPEDLRELINAYHACCAERVGQHGGYVAKYMGDGVLAYFGYPEAHEDDAAQAIYSALSILDGIPALPAKAGFAPQARIGIATGLVVVGDLIGAGSAQERNVVGETPNLAARLQDLADPGTVVIATSTHRLARGLFEYRDLGEARLRGFAEPIRAWQVIGPSGVESRFDAFHPTGFTPLVGREEELDLLVRRWGRARCGEGRVVVLSGEPGIGKSRITAALHERIESDEHIRLRYFCSPRHQDSALYPVITQLERAAGFARDDGISEKLRKLKALLATASPESAEFALLAELLSLSDHESIPVVRDMAPRRKREKTLEALLLQLEALASHQPVLMVFEDVHWIDPTSLELLGMIVERIQQLPVLLLVTARPEFTPPWPSHAHVTTLSLTRLSRQEGAALAQHVTGGKALPKEVMDQILARTDGVPLFVEELTKMLMESSLLQERAGDYILDGPLPTLAIPATLHDSLMARLDRLSPVRDVAQIGAAIGREFSYELLSAVAGLSDLECDEALVRLVQSELVFRRGTPPQAVYMFKHALVRDAVYGTLLLSRRQHLHARIASSLEEKFPEIAAGQPELLAQHCVEAGLNEKAAVYWLAAGRLAVARSATAEAVTQLKKGLDLIASLPDQPERQYKVLEFDLQVALGGALMAAKGYAHPEVVVAYERARSLAADIVSGSSMVTFPVLWGLCTASYVAGNSHAALHQAKELLSVAQTQAETGPLVIGHGLVGCTLIMNADFTGALVQLRRAVSLYDPAGHRPLTFQFAQDIGVRAFCYLSIALWHCGYPDQATKAAGEALRYAKEAAHAHTLAYALYFSAMTALFQRQVAEVEELANASISLSDQHGFALWLARCKILQGWTMAQAGLGLTAVERVREGISATAATGSKLWEPLLLGLFAEALGLAGEIDEGIRVLSRGFAAADVSGQLGANAELHRLRGEMLRQLANPDLRQAERCFRSAIAVAREQGSRGFELRAAISLARLLGDQGRRGEARDALAPVYAQFHEGFDMPDLVDAKSLLDVLGTQCVSCD
jgi:predicted ATPase/class 3 adenylate cyclase